MRPALATTAVYALLFCGGKTLAVSQSVAVAATAVTQPTGRVADQKLEQRADDSPLAADENPVADFQSTEPLPDIPALMHQVEQNQRGAEAIEKTYIYRSVETQQELDSYGQVKKSTETEADHFWLNGVPVRRIMRRNGKDLTPEELAKENDRIEKEAHKNSERRQKTEAQGKESDARGNEEITVSRLLSLGTFANARRVKLNGRSTIMVAYTGDPRAKTRNRGEDVIKDMAGIAWVDEADKMLVRVEGHFVNTFKIGAGLVADIKSNTRFEFQQTKVNDEVWLPARIKAQGVARLMLFVSFSGQVEVVDSEYRKFRATAKVLPDMMPLPDAPSEPTVQVQTHYRPID